MLLTISHDLQSSKAITNCSERDKCSWKAVISQCCQVTILLSNFIDGVLGYGGTRITITRAVHHHST